MERLKQQYRELLEQYLASQDEKVLYFAQQFSRKFIEQEVAPEDLVHLHKDAISTLFPEAPEAFKLSYDFLIEMMIHYGLALREHQSMIKKREELQMEIEIAANMQDTLIKTTLPVMEELDIGYVSEPAKKMSGDYIYFTPHSDRKVSVAVADVIGKGIPAALCMSTIKFGMDSLSEEQSSPHDVLSIINRLVEKSIDDSMFISMYYGMYDESTSIFTYGSAGHEPALLYRAVTDSFHYLESKGLLLGVKQDVQYEEQQVKLEAGDFIAIMTDGVTEIRTSEGFLDEAIIQSYLRQWKDESAQQMSDQLYHALAQLQDFKLHDDFTVAILKKRTEGLSVGE